MGMVIIITITENNQYILYMLLNIDSLSDSLGSLVNKKNQKKMKHKSRNRRYDEEEEFRRDKLKRDGLYSILNDVFQLMY